MDNQTQLDPLKVIARELDRLEAAQRSVRQTIYDAKVSAIRLREAIEAMRAGAR